MYEMNPLKYGYKDLEPYYSEETLKLHYDILYKGYTDNFNNTLSKLKSARADNSFENIKSLEKDLSFYGSGYVLHGLFFDNMIPNGNTNMSSKLGEYILRDFGNIDNLKKQMKEATTKVEGSGWGILGYSRYLNKLVILQCEKHQDLTLWTVEPILVVDIWEHSYYLQYKTDKDKYFENIWSILDWNEVSRRFNNILK